ncbi:hypothetical protein HXW73_14725 [Halomonas sp. SH5A2]|uniref:hypothetical protein n=1 Tax=Halomonas sp. SH5A2 TaxID=2749040 RepID=UPI00163E9E44|nr:hypothetical protein [Halomonas sp. SH5A2]QNI04082.1 hypothetical protein HXW73_14725 [Halomonas sp. SH5A2]
MTMTKVRAWLKNVYVTNAFRLFQIPLLFNHWHQRHELKIVTMVLLVAMLLSGIALPFLQGIVGGYFNDEVRLATLRSLFVGSGSALIGAATIAFSLVVFAMQINVERMPHGLFSQLSSDSRLLGSFLGSFLTALAIAGMALIPDGNWAVPAIITAIWGIAVILLLFLYAYRRALQLINPIQQLSIMSMLVQRDLRRWNRLADKAVMLLRESPKPGSFEDDTELHFNVHKADFYQVNALWTKSAEQAIHYAISYAKRFAEQGDYEVTDYAFERIMLINATYCAAKHGTFVGSNPLFETSGTTDNFINTALEQLRQTMQTSLTKGDERLAESTLRAIGGLYGVYLKIEYPGHNQSKHHALLASGYLASAVESIIPHDKPDLMMEGTRLMGRASRLALDHTNPTDIVSAVQKIANLSYVGVLNTSHQPVTLTSLEQLADITYDLLEKGKYDIGFTVRQLRSAVAEAAKLFLETPETQLGSMHRNTLGPYFSSTSVSSLRGRLTSLVNQLLEAPADNARAGEIILNIENWADQMYDPQKELLLLAVQKRSSFTFDVIDWAVGVSEILNALSNAPACSQHLKDKLRRHAVWLISTLSWLPDDRDAVIFVEQYSLTENLFEAAWEGQQRNCPEFYESCKRLLMVWANKGGRHETVWGIFERAIMGLIALTISEGTPVTATALKTQFREMLSSEGAPSPELRGRTAANLIRSANQFRHLGAMHSRIEYVLAQLDQTAVSSLVHEMAEILATDTSEQPPSNNGDP